MMPGLTGLEAVKEMRANPEMADIPVILLTARAQQSDVQIGYDSGADDYITKPFSPKDLAARVEALLARGLTAVSATLPSERSRDRLRRDDGEPRAQRSRGLGPARGCQPGMRWTRVDYPDPSAPVHGPHQGSDPAP